jgi:hypothetical protein
VAANLTDGREARAFEGLPLEDAEPDLSMLSTDVAQGGHPGSANGQSVMALGREVL